MEDFEQTLLEAAKDAFEVLTEDGGNKEEALATVKEMYDSPNRSEEFKKELEALKEEDLEQLISNVTKDEIQLTKREELEIDIENLKYDIQSLDTEYMDLDEYGQLVDLRDERYDKELETLEEKLASKEQELASLDKENSLDDLIKGAVEKTEDQPIKNNPVKEMER